MIAGGLSKASVRVLTAIKDNAATQSEILSATRLSIRAVKYAVAELKEKGLVSERINFRDTRKKLYFCRGGQNV